MSKFVNKKPDLLKAEPKAEPKPEPPKPQRDPVEVAMDTYRWAHGDLTSLLWCVLKELVSARVKRG